MLRVEAKQSDLDLVKLPSECMQLYRTVPRIKRDLSTTGLYWAIEIVSPKERIAHLIKEDQRQEFQRPGIRSVIPAYKKEN